MMRACKQELYRVLHSRPLLFLLAVCLFLGFLCGSYQPLATEAEYVGTMEARYGILHIDTAKKVLGAADSRAETWEALYREVQVHVNYFWFMPCILSLIPAGLVLSLLQLASGRDRGTLRSCGRLGGSVGRAAAARLLVFYLLALLLLLPIQLLQTAVYCPGLGERWGS